MRFDPSSLVVGLLVGAAGAVSAVPVAGFLAETVSWPSLAISAALAAGAAVTWFRRTPAVSKADPFRVVDEGLSFEPLALTPEEWLRQFGAVGASGPQATAVVREKLAGQLDRPGLDNSAIRVLGLCFAFHFLGLRVKGKTALEHLDALAAIMTGPRGGREWKADAMLKGLESDPGTATADLWLEEMRARHGTPETLLVAALAMGRARRGALPSSDFVWLKGYQRGLWYGLNNLGRRNSYHVEGVGVMAHYQAELHHGAALTEPAVDAAVGRLVRLADSLRRLDEAMVARPEAQPA